MVEMIHYNSYFHLMIVYFLKMLYMVNDNQHSLVSDDDYKQQNILYLNSSILFFLFFLNDFFKRHRKGDEEKTKLQVIGFVNLEALFSSSSLFSFL